MRSLVLNTYSFTALKSPLQWQDHEDLLKMMPSFPLSLPTEFLLKSILVWLACWLVGFYRPQQHASVPQGWTCSDKCTCCHTVVVCWLLSIPATCLCISGTDLLRQFYVLLHWDRSWRSNFLPHPVSVLTPGRPGEMGSDPQPSALQADILPDILPDLLPDILPDILPPGHVTHFWLENSP